MTKLLNRLGDRMLTAVLPATEAGACVPEMGEDCNCITDTSRRPGTGRCDNATKKWIYFKFTYRLDCYGRCTVRTGYTCGEAFSGQPCSG